MIMTLDSLWASLPVPTFLLDEEARIAMINPAAEGFINASQRVIEGQYLWHTILVEKRVEESFSIAQAQRSELFVNDIKVTIGTGSCNCNIKVAPFAETTGHMILMIEPRQFADKLIQSQSVKASAKSAIGMAEMLAHEIKNPLAGITGAAQLLSMGLEDKDLELTDLIVEETHRILGLLEQVEEFGNVRPPQLAEVNLHDVLDKARRSAQLGYGAHMRFIEEFDPSLPPAWADADQLLQVFLNLIKNAVEACAGKNGEITLRTFFELSFNMRRADGNGSSLPLQIEIHDNGTGISPDLQSDIFEPFVSGRDNGKGLGLALVSKIISDHNGWLAVSSQPGHTMFRISLPRVPQKRK